MHSAAPAGCRPTNLFSEARTLISEFSGRLLDPTVPAPRVDPAAASRRGPFEHRGLYHVGFTGGTTADICIPALLRQKPMRVFTQLTEGQEHPSTPDSNSQEWRGYVKNVFRVKTF